MNARDILVFTEEPSAAPVVRHIAQALGIGHRVRIVEHDGVGDLKRSLASKILAELGPDRKFLILRDGDGLDCLGIKRELTDLVPPLRRERTLVRIVCQELESWYLAQPAALKRAGVLASAIPGSILRKPPDALTGPKQIFLKHAHRRGQMDNARKIAPHLDIDSRTSASFAHVVLALRRLAAI